MQFQKQFATTVREVQNRISLEIYCNYNLESCNPENTWFEKLALSHFLELMQMSQLLLFTF